MARSRFKRQAFWNRIVDPRPLVHGMKRVLILMLVFIALAGLTGGLAWFHFVYKPEMIRGFIAAAPQPVTSVAVAEAREEEWLPRAPAIGTFRAAQGVDVAPQIGGVIVAINFESGQDVKKGSPLVQIDDSVEQADLKANQATLRNAELGARSPAPAREHERDDEGAARRGDSGPRQRRRAGGPHPRADRAKETRRPL